MRDAQFDLYKRCPEVKVSPTNAKHEIFDRPCIRGIELHCSSTGLGVL